MALDAHVMPLWRFKAGDFSSPIENALGIEPTIITIGQPVTPRPPFHLRILAKLGIIELIPPTPEPTPEERTQAAVDEVEALKSELSEKSGVEVDWSDQGEIHYSEQFHEPVVLRAFAAWCDHRDEIRSFDVAPELNYYKHPVWELTKPEERRFPVLADHSLHNGYFLPVPFDGCFSVEPWKVHDHWEFFHSVASTHTALAELDDLLQFISSVPEIKDEESGSIPVADARWYAEELKKICSLSIEHGLPVIFHG